MRNYVGVASNRDIQNRTVKFCKIESIVHIAKQGGTIHTLNAQQRRKRTKGTKRGTTMIKAKVTKRNRGRRAEEARDSSHRHPPTERGKLRVMKQT